MDFYRYYFHLNNIFEGGNVKVGGNVNFEGESADKIPMEKLSEKQFNQLKSEIIETLHAFNDDFKKEYGEYLWKNLNELVKNGDIFSGSTRLFFTKPFKDLRQYKKFVGDIDIQIPEEKMPQLKEFLPKNKGNIYGKMIYFGQGGKSPIQINTIFKTGNYPDILQNLQIDFEPTFWKDNKPTEFSKFAHFSSWEDLKSNIKGVFIKFLLRALIGRERLGDIAVLTKTGKISKNVKFDDPALRGFSVDKGVRVKFEPIIDNKTGEIKKTDDGKPMYRETDTKTVEYERNLDDIFALSFGEKPSPGDKKDFHSFKGTLKLMKKYLDKEVIKNVFDKFLEIIFGDIAQEIEQGEFKDGVNVEDFKVKKAAYDEFIKVFPFTKMSEKELKQYVEPFYTRLKKKKGL